MDHVDDAILKALTHDVRVLTVGQIGRYRWCGDQPIAGAAEERLLRLQKARLVEVVELLARPELDLSRPEIDWAPHLDQEPRFGAISYRLKKRWNALPVPTLVVRATRVASRQYGGYNNGYRLRPDEVTHDIHVGALWMKQSEKSALELFWTGEGKLRAEGTAQFAGRIPDGVLRRPGQTEPVQIVEFGGAYGPAKLRDIHRAFCEYPYAVW